MPMIYEQVHENGLDIQTVDLTAETEDKAKTIACFVLESIDKKVGDEAHVFNAAHAAARIALGLMEAGPLLSADPVDYGSSFDGCL